MKNFTCHHIVRMLGVVKFEPVWQNPPALVMEWMALGDLASYLRQRERRDDCSDGVVKPKLALTWAAEIADGMAFLSRRNLVHRDLAARNCLVDEQLTVKISDFGLARCMSADEYYRRRGQTRLPIRWMAPESLSRSYFTTQSDVWSYGIVLWEIATFAALPYSGFSHEQVISHVTQGGHPDLHDWPARLPSVLHDLMLQCWSFVFSDRPTFMDILDKLDSSLDAPFRSFILNLGRVLSPVASLSLFLV
ncbi:Insulin receptor [Fasciola gigantica]|uniref:Insulin receptor n=1 Tax=Fasciola gigantica TaxID=46835 RepID=A0A504YQ10_FASGI|nr:Insulin receptor [Fasciola gigantica]